MEKADDIEAFFEANKVPHSQRKISQTLERIRVNARFLDRLKTEIGVDSGFWEEL